MKKIIILALAGVSLAACGTTAGHTPPPEIKTVTVTQDRYVPVTVDPKYTAKDACPGWPKSTDYVVNKLDSGTSDYLFAAFKSWSCEHSTRMKIGSEEQRIANDVKAQSDDKKGNP